LNSHTTGSTKKRKRDPNKPKRQQTAYTLFVSENYDHIKRTHDPNMPGKDIISMVARQWAATSEEEKLVSTLDEFDGLTFASFTFVLD
jgi:hypothetical protein